MKSAHFHLSVFGHLSRRGKVKYTEKVNLGIRDQTLVGLFALAHDVSRNIEGDEV